MVDISQNGTLNYLESMLPDTSSGEITWIPSRLLSLTGHSPETTTHHSSLSSITLMEGPGIRNLLLIVWGPEHLEKAKGVAAFLRGTEPSS